MHDIHAYCGGWVYVAPLRPTDPERRAYCEKCGPVSIHEVLVVEDECDE